MLRTEFEWPTQIFLCLLLTRPRDFDEELVRRSPTFRKWACLLPGGKLRYACRDFVKGQGDDEERLMRRIMIARRNNVRDHQALKWARRMQSNVSAKDAERMSSSVTDQQFSLPQSQIASKEAEPANNRTDGIKTGENHNPVNNLSESGTNMGSSREKESPPRRRSRRPNTLISDETIKEEMDVAAVESTRSYKTWLSLPNGAQFLYNQKYIKGYEAHDWLLRKNIWRRMRYRRENKKMVEEMLMLERGEPITQQSKKRRLDQTVQGKIARDSSITRGGSNNHTSDVVDLNKMMADASVPAIAVNSTATAVVGLGMGTSNDTNRQEVVASTASKIVDHALLSTNTDDVPAPELASVVHTSTGDTVTTSIADSHHQNPAHSLHPGQQSHHHHDATESAAAFAASIALAGVGIGSDGDLASNHDTAVADSAAVEAAVAAALAATDAKSNSYHHHSNHHLSHSAMDHHSGLIAVDHVVHHGSNNSLAGTISGEGGLHLMNPVVEASKTSMTIETGVATAQATQSHPSQGSVDTGLGLALDAAAKLAAAAVATTTCDSNEAVLAATKAITVANVTESTAASNDVTSNKVQI